MKGYQNIKISGCRILDIRIPGEKIILVAVFILVFSFPDTLIS